MNIQEVKETLTRAFRSFSPDELAYLSLTSKNEFPVRDRFAYETHKAFPETVVSREFKKIDLAIFSEGETVRLTDIFEFKSWYLFDLYNEMEKITSGTDYDFVKNSKFTDLYPDARQYAIIIATHPTQPIKLKYNDIVKYLSRVNKMANSQALAGAGPVCDRKVREHYARPEFEVEQFIFDAGQAFGCKVEVYTWIVEKLKS